MSHPRSTSQRVSHYIYNAVYVLLCLLLAALILVTPGDAIRQTYFNTLQYTSIVIIAIAYLVTVLIVLFIYSLRLYVTRTVLASIPKSWIPIGKGEVKKGVREMIGKELGRSAAIAWHARPKVGSAAMADGPGHLDVVAEEEDGAGDQNASRDVEKGRRLSPRWPRLKKVTTVENEMGISLPPTKPVWGNIEHPGWGSPDSPDLANVQYSAVLAELPNLIEAKAMSLAPPLTDASGDASLFDPEALAVLQRTGNMGMRSYVGRLVDLGVLESSEVAEFLDVYERARFSTRPIPVAMFRRLMHLFAHLLRSAAPLDRDVLDTMRDMDDMYPDSETGSRADEGSIRRAGGRNHHADIDDDAPQHTGPTTPARSTRSLRTLESNPSLEASGSPGSVRVTRRPGMVARNSSPNTRTQYGTAPTTPKSRTGRSTAMSQRRQRLRSGSKTGSSRSGSSANSFAQTRRPFMAGSLGSRSQGSSLRSSSRGSQGSVIRLARHDDAGDLPYVLRVSDTF